MTINPGAIEAAVKALHGDQCPEDPDPGDYCLCDDAFYERAATVALEAAIPHLLPTREQIAKTIWETSRLDEGYVSYIGANKLADAVLALIGDPACCAHPKCPGGSLCCCQNGDTNE